MVKEPIWGVKLIILLIDERSDGGYYSLPISGIS